jgi:hypothetical protein
MDGTLLGGEEGDREREREKEFQAISVSWGFTNLCTVKLNTDQNINLFSCAPSTVKTVILGSTSISHKLYFTFHKSP